VFCTFLDATKAFDGANYCKQFGLLLKRGLPACIIRILNNFYVGNHVRVAWNEDVSDYFTAVNGVEQGGVLNLVLFCIYMDGLLLVLPKANVGCCIL
jgi:hypothetical protein